MTQNISISDKSRQDSSITAVLQKYNIKRRGHDMNLSKKDTEIFFKIWYLLLHSTNERYGIVPSFRKPVSGEQADKESLFTIRSVLREDPGLIDEFIEEDGRDMSEEEKDILRSWSDHSVTGEFVVMEHLRDHSVLMTEQDDGIKLYGVKGISEPISSVMRGISLPCFIETVLMCPKYHFPLCVCSRSIALGTTNGMP
jgi:hypothetical protein